MKALEKKSLKTKLVAILGSFSLIGLASLPVAAFVGPEVQIQPIQAEVLPSPQELQNQLSVIGQRLHTAQLASTSYPAAERDFVAAQHDYLTGWYQQAMIEANAANEEMTPAPNWIGQNGTELR